MSDTLLVGSGPNTPQPLAGCCSAHPDWATLAEHLVAEFTELGARPVVDTVRRARDAVDLAALTGVDALATGETIARYQLLLLSGEADEVARLDSQRHHHRGRSAPGSGRG